MPIKRNAKKALRRAKKRALQNAVVRVAYKDAMKAAKKAAIAGQDVKELARLAQQKLDKAAKRGVIKKKAAGRKLSRLLKHLETVAKAPKKK